MSDSRLYLINLLGGVLLLLFLWIFSFYLVQLEQPTASTQWVNELFTNKMQAARHFQGERLFVVGGSGVHFAVDAEKMSKKLGMATINFGTHAALDVEYMLFKLKEVLRPGDTVLLALEYAYYGNRPKFNSVYEEYLVARDRPFFLSLPIFEQLRIVFAAPFKNMVKAYKQNFFKPYIPSKASYEIFGKFHYNPYGDTHANNTVFVNEDIRRTRDKLSPDTTLISDKASALITLRSFATWCNQQKIHLIATVPNHLYFKQMNHETILSNVEKIKNFYAAIQVPFIGDPFSAMFDKAYYFDTVYHPNQLGKALYTRQLIASLKKEAALYIKTSFPKVGVPEKYSDPHEQVLSVFHGWEHVKGVHDFSGPYLSKKHPILVWADPEVTLRVILPKNKKAIFSAKFRPGFDRQKLTVSIDGKLLWSHQYAKKQKFYHLKLLLPAISGEHLIQISSDKGNSLVSDPKHLSLLFKSLVVKSVFHGEREKA